VAVLHLPNRIRYQRNLLSAEWRGWGNRSANRVKGTLISALSGSESPPIVETRKTLFGGRVSEGEGLEIGVPVSDFSAAIRHGKGQLKVRRSLTIGAWQT
jgi:hypothetical protein